MRGANGTTALERAAQHGHAAVVEILLASDPSLVNLVGYGQQLPWMAASRRRHTKLATYLLERTT